MGILTINCTTDLLRAGDPTFTGFLRQWLAEGRVGLPLADYLIEQGLERLAGGVVWMVGEPDRPVRNDEPSVSGPVSKFWALEFRDWGWYVSSAHKLDYASTLPYTLFKAQSSYPYLVTKSGPEWACCLALDAWRGE